VKAAGAIVLLVGLASFGVLAWVSRKIIVLERALQIGDAMILGILALFGAFCAGIAWVLYRTDAPPAQPVESRPKRVSASHVCSTAGVILLMLSALLPAEFYPVVFLFAGLIFLAGAHVLTPCEERLEKLRKARASLTQL
jgi:hypothetical protein